MATCDSRPILRLSTWATAANCPWGSHSISPVTRVIDANYVANAFAIPVDQGAFEANFTAPTAKAGGPYTGGEGQPVTLNGGSSVDAVAIAAITTLQWDCTNDGSFDATGATATCTYGEQGTFTVRLQVTDGEGLTNEATTTVVVSNVPPVAQDDAGTTPKNTPITVDVRANDVDVAADPLTILSVSAPGHGTANITGDQQILYTPALDFVGSDSIVYTIDDGDGGADTAAVQMTVTEDGLPPTYNLLMPLLSR